MLHTNSFIYLFYLILQKKNQLPNFASTNKTVKLKHLYCRRGTNKCGFIIQRKIYKIYHLYNYHFSGNLPTQHGLKYATASQQHIHYIHTPCGNNISAFFNTNWSEINKWINIKRKCQLSCCFTNACIKTQVLRIQENRSQACTSSWWRLWALRLFTFGKTMCFFSGYGLLIITQHRSNLCSLIHQ